MANFGRTSLAWASMGKKSHRLDVVGPHIGSQRHAFRGLHGIMEDLIHPLVPKRLSYERKNITFGGLTSCLRGFDGDGAIAH